MNNQDVRDRLFNEFGTHVTPVWGTSKSKVSAINRDLEFVSDADILILMSDDMEFIQEGFDLEIINDFLRLRPDFDGLLHYPDGKLDERLITMPIMGGKYLERFGYIYNPEYQSLWCDNEQHVVAQMLGRYYYINKPLFIHKHPVWGYGEKDALLEHTESFYNQDYGVFLQRQSKNFDLPNN